MTLPSFCGKILTSLTSFVPAAVVICVCLGYLPAVFVPAATEAASTCREMNNRKIVDLINSYRLRNGLTILKPNPRLRVSTNLKVKDMTRQSYFAHTSPQGRHFSENIRKARYDYRSVAEVLAKGCRNEEQVLSLWTRSRPHNDALLDPIFLDINCSSSVSRGLTYVACHLGRPMARISY